MKILSDQIGNDGVLPGLAPRPRGSLEKDAVQGGLLATRPCVVHASVFDIPRSTGRSHRRRELQTPSKEGYPSALPAAPPRDTCVPPHLSASIMGASEPSTSAPATAARIVFFLVLARVPRLVVAAPEAAIAASRNVRRHCFREDLIEVPEISVVVNHDPASIVANGCKC